MAESPASAPPGAVGNRISYDEFLRAYDGEKAEWVDGWVYPVSPVGGMHQDVGQFLIAVLGSYIRQNELGKLRYEKFQMRLGDVGREPDILFLATEHLDRLHETYLDGPADLAIEIVSPESRVRDRGVKFYEYEQAGVGEYWLIDPERKAGEFYVLIDGRFVARLPDDEGTFRSEALPGFWLPVDWLWSQPDPLEAAAELGLR